MEPAQPESLQPSQPSTPSASTSTFLSRKKLVIGTLFVLILLLIIFSLFQSKNSKQTVKPKTTGQTKQITTLSGLEVAEKIAIFLKKAKRGDGSFYLRYRCSPTIQDICVVQMEEGPSGQITIAFLELFKKTQTLEYKLIADGAIAYQLAACQKDTKECERAMKAFGQYHTDTNDKRYKDAVLKAAQNVLKEKPLGGHLANNDGGKLEYLHKVTGEETYRNTLIGLADRFLSGEFQGQASDVDFFISDYVYLPAYRVTNDTRYLEAAKAVFTKANLSSTVSQFSQTENSYALVVALDALVTLAQSDVAFADDAKAVGEFLLRTLWDNPQNKKFVADFGFVHYFEKRDPNFKSTVNNAWLALSFAKMEKESFTLR